jgi:hypothetical protein
MLARSGRLPTSGDFAYEIKWDGFCGSFNRRTAARAQPARLGHDAGSSSKSRVRAAPPRRIREDGAPCDCSKNVAIPDEGFLVKPHGDCSNHPDDDNNTDERTYEVANHFRAFCLVSRAPYG